MTTYTGQIEAELGDATLHVLPGTDLLANNSGSWRPDIGNSAASAPANYGGQVDANAFLLGTIFLAIREAAFNLASTADIPLGADGSFSTESWVAGSKQGRISSTVGSPQTNNFYPYSAGTQAVALGSSSKVMDWKTVTLPVRFEIEIGVPVAAIPDARVTFRFEGVFVGTRAVPEPSASLSLGLAAGLALMRTRSNRRQATQTRVRPYAHTSRNSPIWSTLFCS
jgi:hypothetical protein